MNGNHSNDCNDNSTYRIYLHIYDSRWDGVNSISMTSVAYEFIGAFGISYLSGSALKVNPMVNLFRLRSPSYATSGTLKLMVTGIFSDS